MPNTVKLGQYDYDARAVANMEDAIRKRLLAAARKRGISLNKIFRTINNAMEATKPIVGENIVLKEPDHFIRLKAAEFSWKEIYGLGVAKKTQVAGPNGGPIPVKVTHVASLTETQRTDLKRLADMRAQWERERLLESREA